MENREKKPRNHCAKPRDVANHVQTRLPHLPHGVGVSHRMQPRRHLHTRNESDSNKNCENNVYLGEARDRARKDENHRRNNRSYESQNENDSYQKTWRAA